VANTLSLLRGGLLRWLLRFAAPAFYCAVRITRPGATISCRAHKLLAEEVALTSSAEERWCWGVEDGGQQIKCALPFGAAPWLGRCVDPGQSL